MARPAQDQLKLCYGAFVICVITSSIPQMTVQIFAMVFSAIVLIALYIVRRNMIKDSFEHTEIKSLIKTFWVWTALYIVGILVAGLLVSSFGDMTAINEWTEAVVHGASPDEESMKLMTEQYMATNFKLMMTMTILSVLPAQAYALLRVKQGFARLKNPPAPPVEAIIG